MRRRRRQDVERGEQRFEARGRRELRRAAEAAGLAVGAFEQSRRGVAQTVRTGRLRRDARGSPRELRDDLGRALLDLGTLCRPGAAERVEHFAKRRQPVSRHRREVGAAVEGPAVGRAEHRERPAALTARAHHEVHVDAVEVGTLLAIDLHRHEALVQQRRRLLVLERLALHHVAPVTGAVADRDEQRLVFVARLRERRVAPRMPVHRVVHVLAEVGARLGGEAIGRTIARGVHRARVAAERELDVAEAAPAQPLDELGDLALVGVVVGRRGVRGVLEETARDRLAVTGREREEQLRGGETVLVAEFGDETQIEEHDPRARLEAHVAGVKVGVHEAV